MSRGSRLLSACRRTFGALALLICLLPVNGWAADKVVLQLKWKHQFQFAGYYAALAQGFFADEGLTVSLREGGPGLAPFQEVLAGRADYGVEGGELVYHRLRGRSVVALAAILQHSPSVLMTAKGSGLHTPHDLAGHRVAMLVGGLPIVELAAMFVNEGVGLEQLVLQENVGGIERLFHGEVDAEYGYLTNEPFLLRQQGREVHFIRPIAYGVDFYGDILFTTERELRTSPQRVAALHRAVVRGWSYALAHVDETIRLIKEHYAPALDEEHLRYEAGRIRELMVPDIVEIGHMNPGRWRRMADTFVQLGMVESGQSLDGFLYLPADPGPEQGRLWYLIELLGALALAGGLIAALSVLFSRRLQSLVERRTVELSGTNERLQEEIRRRTEAETELLSRADDLAQSVRRRNRELTESHRVMHTLLGNLPGIVYRCRNDRDWTMEFVSEACLDVTGYAPADLVDNAVVSYSSLIHSDDRERVWNEVQDALGHREAFDLVYRILDRRGRLRWVHERGCGVRGENGDLIALEGLISEVTELKQAEQAAAEANLAKGRYLAHISHELSTPLNAILGYTRRLMEGDPVPSRQQDALSVIERNGRHLLVLVNDILDMTRIETGRLRLLNAPLALKPFLEQLAGQARERARAKGIAFDRRYDGALPAGVVADAKRLSQILTNLLSNAVKFTDRGRVTLTVLLREHPAADLATLEFAVEDTGMGIARDDIPVIMQPFEQAFGGRVAEGTGLGLAISRELVSMMGGELVVRSEPGKGSRFSFTLTLPQVVAESPEDAARKVAEPEPGCRRPPADRLRPLLELARLGRRRRIVEWCRNLRDNEPEYAEFASRVLRMAEALQDRKILKELEGLLEITPGDEA